MLKEKLTSEVDVPSPDSIQPTVVDTVWHERTGEVVGQGAVRYTFVRFALFSTVVLLSINTLAQMTSGEQLAELGVLFFFLPIAAFDALALKALDTLSKRFNAVGLVLTYYFLSHGLVAMFFIDSYIRNLGAAGGSDARAFALALASVPLVFVVFLVINIYSGERLFAMRRPMNDITSP